MKKILMSDNWLKIISILIAILIWFYISIVMDPAIEVSVRDLPIQFVGVEALNAKGLAVMSESATTLSLNVKGSRKKMGKNDMKTIVVKADISGIDNAGVQSVPIDIAVPFENQGIPSQTIYSVDVKVERRIEKTLNIDINTVDSLAEDYIANGISAEPSQIVISGPESAIEKISKASVTLDYDNGDVDIDTSLPVILSGENGKEISSLDAILKRVNLSAENINIHCPVVKIKKVAAKADFMEKDLPHDFKFKISPDILCIYGDNPNISRINEILTERVNVEKLLDNDKIKVRLNIPDGIKIVDDVSEVEISVEKQ